MPVHLLAEIVSDSWLLVLLQQSDLLLVRGRLLRDSHLEILIVDHGSELRAILCFSLHRRVVRQSVVLLHVVGAVPLRQDLAQLPSVPMIAKVDIGCSHVERLALTIIFGRDQGF